MPGAAVPRSSSSVGLSRSSVWSPAFARGCSSAEVLLALAVLALRAAASGWAGAVLAAAKAGPGGASTGAFVSALEAASFLRTGRSGWAAFGAPLPAAAVPRSSSSVGLSRSSVWSAAFARGRSSAAGVLLLELALAVSALRAAPSGGGDAGCGDAGCGDADWGDADWGDADWGDADLAAPAPGAPLIGVRLITVC